ncbi:MAG: hypothetical protein P1Q69_06940 [Candidatus Thorarchaeota archaeon]|nr:hypothetical protein [Candidatus Thorarchaeota archaeon]
MSIELIEYLCLKCFSSMKPLQKEAGDEYVCSSCGKEGEINVFTDMVENINWVIEYEEIPLAVLREIHLDHLHLDEYSIESSHWPDAWELKCGNKEYLLIKSVEIAEKMAHESVKDFMEDEVSSALHNSSLSGWSRDHIKRALRKGAYDDMAEDVIDIDGWEHELARYDGNGIYLNAGWVMCRVN